MTFQSINHRKDRQGDVEEGGVKMRGDEGGGGDISSPVWDKILTAYYLEHGIEYVHP